MKFPMRIWQRVALLVTFAFVFAIGLRKALEMPLRRRMVAKYTPVYRPPSATPPASGIAWIEVAHGFRQPTDIQFVPGASGLAIVLEKAGTARLVDLGGAGRPSPDSVAPLDTVFDLHVRTDSELGLLGLAFHPKYRENGLLYIDWNPSDGDIRTRISEWRYRRAEGKPAHDERAVLEATQLYQNHKGGQLQFGPDGFLYVGLGDGGWRNDPDGNGQNTKVLLGKMLRIDVDGRGAGRYGIPKDNPFVGKAGVRPEIWAYGLRNPWRYSFDGFGRLVVADVGQDRFEEIDIVHAGDNLGWSIREATHCFNPQVDCPRDGLVDPVFEYGREAGTCITGGYVYTGSSVSELRDQYVFGDFVSGAVWAMKLPGPYLAGAGPGEARLLGNWPFLISSFGRGEDGELYLLDYSSGKIFRLSQR
jgi:glucose/arabinose dehydrogenase